MSEQKLKLCPSCSAEAVLRFAPSLEPGKPDPTMASVCCSQCPMGQLHVQSTPNAIAAWNTRAASSDPVEALKGLLAIVKESQGVAGYHLNGDVADWSEFESYISDAETALANYGGGE